MLILIFTNRNDGSTEPRKVLTSGSTRTCENTPFDMLTLKQLIDIVPGWLLVEVSEAVSVGDLRKIFQMAFVNGL